MAGVLFRFCCLKPCQSCCNCMNDCCSCVGITCDSIANIFDKPFSCCLFITFIINIILIIYGILVFITHNCVNGSTVLIYGIILLICGMINILFSIYLYKTINKNADKFQTNNDNNLSV